ncbi:MAG: replication initiation protein [Rhodothermales bacterium]
MRKEEMMDIEYDPRNHLVAKSNALIEAAQMRFSAMQQRVLHAVLTQIRKGDRITDEVMYQIPITAIADLAGQDATKLFYERTREAAKALRIVTITVKRDPKGDPLPDGITESIISPFQTVNDKSDRGQIWVRFNKDAIPYFSDLVGVGFTQYSVTGGLLHMDSAYAYRLHDLIARWGDIGMKEIDLDEFRWMMGVDEDKYKRFNSFRERVLDIAIRQINEHSQFDVKVCFRKRSRRVVALQFAFRVKSQAKMKNGIRYITRNVVQREGLAHAGEQWGDCIKRLRRQGIVVRG